VLELTDQVHLSAFDEVEKIAKEFAPGLPEKSKISKLPKVKKPQTWEASVQRHVGVRAGEHSDVRLGNPRTGVAHSWVLKHGLPKPGMRDKRYHLGIQQGDHTIPYMDFEGELPPGYGQGPVKLETRQQADVYHSDPKKVRFNLYTGKGPEEFTARRVGDREYESLVKNKAISSSVDPKRVWAFHNKTPTKERLQLPMGRPPYKDKKPGQAQQLFEDPDTIIMPKLDGAHNQVALEKGKVPRVISYREPQGERPGGVIEHTHKVPSVLRKKVPAGLGGTVLRGETIAVDRKGRAIPAEELAGLLNSSVWNSRSEQRRRGVELRQSIFDVARYKGRDYQDQPYAKKLQVLRAVNKKLPSLFIPPIARTAGEAEKMLGDIKSGKNKLTGEGVVAWNLKGGRPTRIKLTEDHDVYVRKIHEEKGKRGPMAGGFSYSHTPDGPIVGRVGTGMDHKLKKDMLENPQDYIGRAAKIIAEKKTKSGALAKPRFSEWHLDKGVQPMDKAAGRGHAARRLGQRTRLPAAALARIQRRIGGAALPPGESHHVPLRDGAGHVRGFAVVRGVGRKSTPVVTTVYDEHMDPPGSDVEHLTKKSYIRELDGRFEVVSHKIPGKVLGRHPSRGRAEAQLRAIQVRKRGAA